MAFLQDQTVIHIKLTDKGRELLSRGQLTFKKFAVGDSEIDYEFNNNSGLNAANALIARPFDNTPDIVSFITEDVGGDIYTSLPEVVNKTTTVTNTTNERGMFTVGVTTKILDDAAHSKQANIQIDISTVVGGRELTLNQTNVAGNEYVNESPEPEVGDYILVKWTNRYSDETTLSFDVDKAVPYLFYKIITIESGTLATNDLVVTVDRDLPDYSGVATPFNTGALIYPNNNNRNTVGDSIQNYYGAPFVTDFVSESMIAFLQNYDTPTIDVPVWNMSIIFTEDVAGIDPSTYRGIGGNPTVQFGGLVRYFQRVDPTVTNIGLIHYSNQSPSNIYGEGFFASNTTTPVLELPTIMWHKNTGATMGMTLTGDYSSINTLPDINTPYMNLIDDFGNIVGKVFTDLKLFVIEDQELLFAMSYKGNRNWTLPTPTIEFNTSLCPPSDVGVTIDDVIQVS